MSIVSPKTTGLDKNQIKAGLDHYGKKRKYAFQMFRYKVEFGEYMTDRSDYSRLFTSIPLVIGYVYKIGSDSMLGIKRITEDNQIEMIDYPIYPKRLFDVGGNSICYVVKKMTVLPELSVTTTGNQS